MAGHVLSVNISDNQDVSRGMEMVKIDPVDFEIALRDSESNEKVAEGQLRQAQAQLKVVEAQAEQAKADVANAEASATEASADLRRYQSLPAAAVSKQQVDRAVAAAKTTTANLEAARQKQAAAEAQIQFAGSQVGTAGAQVAKARVAVDQARQQLSYTNIIAPIDGTVTDRHVEAGDYVQVGQALLALVPHSVYVTANFKETQLFRMKVGDEVQIHVDAFPGRSFRGKLQSVQRGTRRRVQPAAAGKCHRQLRQGGAARAGQDRIRFPPERCALAPGMSVEPSVELR